MKQPTHHPTRPSPVRPASIASPPACGHSPTRTGPAAWRSSGRRVVSFCLAAAGALGGGGVLGTSALSAQITLSVDGVVESAAGGFRFPDGTTQSTAASAGLNCAAGDFLYCYDGPPDTLGVGQCRPGTRSCTPGGDTFGPCLGQVLPTAEICDGRDNDCDGEIDPGGLCTGELIVSEILYDSSAVPDESHEWFEVFNPNSHPVNMLGWTVRDAAGSAQQILVIQSNLIVAPGDYAVLCHNGDPALNGGVLCAYEYGHFILSNTADELILETQGALVDEVAYDEGAGWPAAASRSLNLDPTALSTVDNDLPANWCASPEDGPEIPNGDKGTPGRPNVPCP